MGLSLGGIGRKILDFGDAVYHGLDPVDGGQGWTSQAPAPPPVSIPHQTSNIPQVNFNNPQAQNAFNQLNQGLDQGKSWEDIAKGIQTPNGTLPVNTVKQYSQLTRPNYGIQGAPGTNINPFNTVPNPITNNPIVDNTIKPILGLSGRAYHTVAALGSSLNAIQAANTHNPVAEQNAMNAAQSDLAPGRAFVNYQQAQQGGGALVKPVLTAGVQIAPLFAGVGVNPESSVASKFAQAGTIGGGTNVVTSAAQQLLENGKINPGELVKSGVQGVALGTAGETIPVLKEAAGGDGKLKINNPGNAKTTGLDINNPGGAKIKPVDITNPLGAVTGKQLKIRDLSTPGGAVKPLSGAAQQSFLGKVKSKITPMNEVGAIGKDVRPKPSAESLSEAKTIIEKTRSGSDVSRVPFAGDETALATHLDNQKGVRPKVSLKEPNLNADMFSKENIAKYDKANAADNAAQPEPTSDFPLKVATGKGNEPLPQNPTAPIKLPDVTNATEAIRASESLASNFEQRAKLLADAQDKVIGKDLSRRDAFIAAVEHPERATEIAKTFGKQSNDFLNLVQQHRDVTDLEHASQQGVGNPRAYFGGDTGGYVHHDVALPTPEDAAAYSALLTHTTRGSTALERMHPDLESLRAAGLDITDKSAGDVTRQWASTQGRIMRDAALQDRLKTLDPNTQVVQVPGENPRFVTGSKELNKQLKGVQPFTAPNALKPINAVNTGLKQVGLFGGGFHDFKTTIREATQEVASGRNPVSRLVEGNKQMLSNTAHDSWNKARLNEGYGQVFADADVARPNIGADLHGGLAAVGKDLTKGSVEKLNPYMNRLFNNKLDYFKKQLVIDEAKRNGITGDNYDPQNPAMRKVVQDAGDQAKNWFGGINQRIVGKSPIMQQALKYVTLAPDFTEGKIRSVGKAFTGGEGGSLARRQVIGEALGVAMLAEAASKGLTGQFTNPVSAVVNPQVKTNMKDNKGRPLTIGLPGSTVADVNRAVTDPAHFATSHLAAGPAVVASAISGKDYYGNPLVDPYKNPTPNFGQNLVASLKSRATIPGVQVSKTLSGQQNAETAVINTLGGRVGLDKTDPGYQQTQAYFKARDDATKNFNPNEKALWQSIHPQTQDAGSYVSSSAPTEQKDIIYQKNPQIFEADKQIALSQPTHDPIFDLSDQQRNDLYNIAQIKAAHGGTTGAGAVGNVDSQYIKTVENSSWYGDFQKSRSDYYDNLNLPTNPLNSTGTTQASPDVQKVLDQMGTPGVNTSSLLAQNPDAEAWLSTHADEINQQRTDKGLPSLPKFPALPDNLRQKEITYNALPQGTGARSAFLKSNPDYKAFWQQKQDYYTAVDGSSGSSSTSSSSSYSSGGSSRHYSSHASPSTFAVSLDAGGDVKKAKVSAKKQFTSKVKVKGKVASSKPRVTVKASRA